MARIKKTTQERVLSVIVYTVLTILCALCIIPLLYSVAASLSSSAALDAKKVFLWPVDITLAAYRVLFRQGDVVKYFANSVVLTVVGTSLSLVATILCAYPLSKKYLWQRKKLSFLMIFTMMFSGGMIPTFVLVKELGLMNSYWAVWLTSLISPYNMMIMRSFFENVPEELSDSARIDGCGEIRLLTQIYLPLSTAVIATIVLFYGVSYWNMYQKIMLYIQDSSKYTLQVFVRQMIFQLQQLSMDTSEASAQTSSNVVSESVKSAGVVIMMLPVMVVYPFVQKYFVKGVTLGAVKG